MANVCLVLKLIFGLVFHEIFTFEEFNYPLMIETSSIWKYFYIL
jgi:hypothetical protein